MRAADAYTIDTYGIPSFTLMESAGRAATDALLDRYAPLGGPVAVLCGKGNNGGDGLVVARQLIAHGATVHVVLMDDDLSDDTRRNRDLLDALQTHAAERLWLHTFDGPDTLDATVGDAVLFVDALLGTGLSSPLREPIRSVVDGLNEKAAPTVALDVPTGLHSDTGAVLGAAVRADLTVTMGAEKVGLRLGNGPQHAGVVQPLEIGIPAFALHEAAATHPGCAFPTTDAAVRAWWPERAPDAHKYSAGMALVIGGAPQYTGAPVLASKAAACSGAGYVLCACPRTVQPALSAQMTAIPTHPLPTTDAGGLDAEAARDALSDVLGKADALLIGPGLGRADGTAAFVREVLATTDLPAVIDADGLNALAGSIDALSTEHAAGRWLLTPHAGELQRLADAPDLSDPVRTAQALADRWNSAVLIKGQPSVVAAPGGKAYIGSTGGPSLATAGSGDVLAGQCVSLLAQGVAPAEAAATALHIGGCAAERYATQRDPRTLTAPALLDALPQAAHCITHPRSASPPRPSLPE